MTVACKTSFRLSLIQCHANAVTESRSSDSDENFTSKLLAVISFDPNQHLPWERVNFRCKQIDDERIPDFETVYGWRFVAFKGNNASAFSNERIFANGAHTHGCLEIALGRITMETICSTAGIQFVKSIFQDARGAVKIKLERKFVSCCSGPSASKKLAKSSEIFDQATEGEEVLKDFQSFSLEPSSRAVAKLFSPPNSK